MAGSWRNARGRHAEDRALTHLANAGLRLVRRNLRSRFGEIDLVMLEGDVLVFIEVRCRSRGARLDAALSVDARKQQKLASTAAWFIGRTARFHDAAVRFDVVAIDGRSSGDYGLQWLQDAFRPGAD